MREKNDLKTVMEKASRENRNSGCLAPSVSPPPFSTTMFGDFIQPVNNKRQKQYRDTLQQQQDLLHDEIERGREQLQRVQKELGDTQASLEQWNRYELISSAQPLDRLIQTMTLQEKTRQFLVDWLNRKQEKLAKVRGDIACVSPSPRKFRGRPSGRRQP